VLVEVVVALAVEGQVLVPEVEAVVAVPVTVNNVQSP